MLVSNGLSQGGFGDAETCIVRCDDDVSLESERERAIELVVQVLFVRGSAIRQQPGGPTGPSNDLVTIFRARAPWPKDVR
jgi:hypothetical protein